MAGLGSFTAFTIQAHFNNPMLQSGVVMGRGD